MNRSIDGDSITTEPITQTVLPWVWKKTRAFNFHVCIDTNKTIWPLQKAYTKFYINEAWPEVDNHWLSAKALTFRKLKR